MHILFSDVTAIPIYLDTAKKIEYKLISVSPGQQTVWEEPSLVNKTAVLPKQDVILYSCWGNTEVHVTGRNLSFCVSVPSSKWYYLKQYFIELIKYMCSICTVLLQDSLNSKYYSSTLCNTTLRARC